MVGIEFVSGETFIVDKNVLQDILRLWERGNQSFVDVSINNNNNNNKVWQENISKTMTNGKQKGMGWVAALKAISCYLLDRFFHTVR